MVVAVKLLREADVRAENDGSGASEPILGLVGNVQELAELLREIIDGAREGRFAVRTPQEQRLLWRLESVLRAYDATTAPA